MNLPLKSGRNQMKPIVMGFFAAFLAAALLIPSPANAQDARVAKSMKALKDQTAELGAPKMEGKEAVGGKDTPALYFGSTKMNNNQDQTAELGAPKMEGKEAVGGKDTPALYFGSTKMNNNLALVDKVAKEGGGWRQRCS
jgi:hypothetical protein